MSDENKKNDKNNNDIIKCVVAFGGMGATLGYLESSGRGHNSVDKLIFGFLGGGIIGSFIGFGLYKWQIHLNNQNDDKH